MWDNPMVVEDIDTNTLLDIHGRIAAWSVTAAACGG